MVERLYLDHAASTPIRPAAASAMAEAMARWANPSSPHAEGRAARAALEDARARIKTALSWPGELIFTSGASEAIALAIGPRAASAVQTSSVEHDAVLRLTKGARRLPVDANGRALLDNGADGLFVVQQANSETGVIQPLAALAAIIRPHGGLLFSDCAQSAGKIVLPDADMIAISAHKFGGPPGVGALLVRDFGVVQAIGGQEQGYRPGTENLPGAMAMAAALEEGCAWMAEAAGLRRSLDEGIESLGGITVARDADRIATIAGYRMPGMSARAQLIQFDMKGISVSAGSACSSGTLKASHVLTAMGWNEQAAGEVVRVSFGPQTNAGDIDRFLDAWTSIARKAAA